MVLKNYFGRTAEWTDGIGQIDGAEKGDIQALAMPRSGSGPAFVLIQTFLSACPNELQMPWLY